MKKILSIFIITTFLTSCGEESVKVEPIKKTDKELSCSDIMLEINDAQFYKKQAEEKKSLGVKSIVMPLGYIDTYMNSDEAIAAAESRIDYLKRIFEIKGCGDVDSFSGKAANERQLQQSLTQKLNNFQNVNPEMQIQPQAQIEQSTYQYQQSQY